MKTGGMIRSQKELLDSIVATVKKHPDVVTVSINEWGLKSHIPYKKRKAEVLVEFEDETMLIIQSIHQKGVGTAEAKFENYLADREKDIATGTPSIIVCSGNGWSRAYMKYMQLRGAIFSEWFESWLNRYTSKTDKNVGRGK